MTQILSDDELFNLWSIMWRTSYMVNKIRDEELAQCGISAVTSMVLSIVHAADGKITPTEISRQTVREAHSVSGLVSRMEKAGLVRKVKDMDRKNVVRVEITEKGRDAQNCTKKRDSIHRVMSVLSEAERKQFLSFLLKLREAVLKEL